MPNLIGHVKFYSSEGRCRTAIELRYELETHSHWKSDGYLVNVTSTGSREPDLHGRQRTELTREGDI